jgi:hypothetical protein
MAEACLSPVIRFTSQYSGDGAIGGFSGPFTDHHLVRGWRCWAMRRAVREQSLVNCRCSQRPWMEKA